MKYHTDGVNDSRFQIRQDKYILFVMQKLNSDLSPTTPLYVWFFMLMWIMIEYVAIADGMNRIFCDRSVVFSGSFRFIHQ